MERGTRNLYIRAAYAARSRDENVGQKHQQCPEAVNVTHSHSLSGSQQHSFVTFVLLLNGRNLPCFPRVSLSRTCDGESSAVGLQLPSCPLVPLPPFDPQFASSGLFMIVCVVK